MASKDPERTGFNPFIRPKEQRRALGSGHDDPCPGHLGNYSLIKAVLKRGFNDNDAPDGAYNEHQIFIFKQLLRATKGTIKALVFLSVLAPKWQDNKNLKKCYAPLSGSDAAFCAFVVVLSMGRLFSLKKLFRGFGYAGSGLKAAFRSEQNFRLHTFAALLAIVFAFFLGVTVCEWLIIIICIVGVMSFELINTAIEKICDQISPEKHPGIKYIKDVSAAAVLLVAAGAFIVALLIFIPRLMQLI
ncbi:diacylglycerol kinase [Niabella aurantiaca]|uniref:diacylglycerol kinase n=1 Tax=Niabella aurantiaca TaxID=379900 RepID=UPI0003652E98|nr:diacylglycerol kinase family protein [Niabella aurantiaca]